MLNRWMQEYIDDIDLNNIQWINLDYDGLGKFLYDNYYDLIDKTYVTDKILYSNYITPIGMNYLYYCDTPNDYKYLLGIVKNKKDKYTIVSAVIYLDYVYFFKEQVNPMTFLCSIEVNYFFRRNGLMKKTCNVLGNFIPDDQDVVISKESEMGKKCNSFLTAYNKIILKNPSINIYSEEELNDIICKQNINDKKKVLKKNK